MQLRKRTVRAVTATELCFLTRDVVHELCEDYPELYSLDPSPFHFPGMVCTNPDTFWFLCSRSDCILYTHIACRAVAVGTIYPLNLPYSFTSDSARMVSQSGCVWGGGGGAVCRCARVQRFRNSSRVMNNRTLKKMDLSRTEMDQLSKQYPTPTIPSSPFSLILAPIPTLTLTLTLRAVLLPLPWRLVSEHE
eukprot:COSAG05_NODE_1782_length_4096_cov_18.941206_2_plen_192_part_00